jgi:peptidase E
MSADAPTILATSGGFREVDTAGSSAPSPMTHIDLAGVSGRAPRVCFVATALGDNPTVLHWLTEAAQVRWLSASHLTLFPMPNVDDISAQLLDHDVVCVFGGSVAGLLAMWRLHGVDVAMRAMASSVVLTGISAGSICWRRRHHGLIGPELRPVTDRLALVPYSNGVHYDSRNNGVHSWRLIADGTLPPGFATDDGARA